MDAQFEPCVIERLMGIDSHWTQQPTEKYRVFSDNYLQKMFSVRMSQQDDKNQVSWMEMELFEPEPDSSNSFHCEVKENGCTDECELSSVPYINESSGYCPSTSDGKICIYPAENDTMKKYHMEGQLDSFRLINSLQDYLQGNIRKSETVDKERKSSNINNQQSFRFRRRIYMDPDKEVGAHTRHVKETMKWLRSGLCNLTATPLLLQNHIGHQRVQFQYNSPSSYFNDPCLRAIQAFKDSWKTSTVSKYGHISFLTSRTCIDKFHRNFFTQMTRQKTQTDKASSVNEVASAATDDRVSHQVTALNCNNLSNFLKVRTNEYLDQPL